MNEATAKFLGEELVNKFLVSKKIDPTKFGTKMEKNTTDAVSQTRSITVTPELAIVFLSSNEAFDKLGRLANRPIKASRTAGEITMLYELMMKGQFAPHRGVLGITEDGRLIEGQGRIIALLKANKTYTFAVDIVRPEQRFVAQYLGATRGTTATTSLAEQWMINFGLTPRQASIAQQVFNGTIWHEEEILGSTLRSSTKAAVVQQTSLPVDLREIAVFYSKAKAPKNVNVSALATIELLAKRKGLSVKKIEDFRDGFLSGLTINARDPRKVVRDFLMGRPKGKTMRYQTQIGYMKSSFDKFMTNADMLKVSAVEVVRF